MNQLSEGLSIDRLFGNTPGSQTNYSLAGKDFGRMDMRIALAGQNHALN